MVGNDCFSSTFVLVCHSHCVLDPIPSKVGTSLAADSVALLVYYHYAPIDPFYGFEAAIAL